MMNVPKELAEEHYVDLSSKPFYKGLVNYIVRYLCCSSWYARMSECCMKLDSDDYL